MERPRGTPPERRTKAYRGGFASSICDLFSRPTRKADCCALACCGLLLADRNRYLTTQVLPPPWWKRLLVNFFLPVGTLWILTRIGDEFVTQDLQPLWHLTTIVVFVAELVFLSLRGRGARMQVREQVMREMHRKKYENSDGAGHIQVDSYIQLHQNDSRVAHGVCRCFHNDVVYTLANGEDDNDMDEQHESPDLCTSLWKASAALCCGVFCNCWCQCFGMCATAQEDRELQRMLPEEKFQVDYITFQPFAEYRDRLQYLRDNQVKSFLEHTKGMSKLSYKLLSLLACCLAGIAVVAVSHMEKHFTPVNLVVVLATFFQAFFILYFVHWCWNRFDLSFDAVVKYFSSGFVLCTGLAFCYEMIISFFLGIFYYIAFVTSMVEDQDTPPEDTDDPDVMKKWVMYLLKEHIAIYVAYVFLTSFVVAALVEEISKYFGFFMMEHPDMMDPPEGRPKRSLQSLGNGITIAMVAVAMGFACCENLVYVFIYTPPSVTNEVAILIVRSIFPIHPLAAAIQSIGVCQRDLEGDRSCGLGRIIFPALLLHGTFDFVMMLLPMLLVLYGDEDEDTTPTDSTEVKQLTMEDFKKQVPFLIVGVVIELVALVYYVVKARAQRSRLVEMDRAHQDGDSSLLV